MRGCVTLLPARHVASSVLGRLWVASSVPAVVAVVAVASMALPAHHRLGPRIPGGRAVGLRRCATCIVVQREKPSITKSKYRGWPPAPRSGRHRPARGQWLVIDSRNAVVNVEELPSLARGVTQKIDSSQALAIIKCPVIDIGDAAGDNQARQAAATLERLYADRSEVVTERDARQPGAGLERRLPDVGDAVANRDTGQVGAGRERPPADVHDLVWNGYARQAGAGTERPAADAGDAVGDNYARQT